MWIRSIVAALSIIATETAIPAVAAPDWSAVEQVLGRPSTQQPDGVHRFGFPRMDFKVDAV